MDTAAMLAQAEIDETKGVDLSAAGKFSAAAGYFHLAALTYRQLGMVEEAVNTQLLCARCRRNAS